MKKLIFIIAILLTGTIQTFAQYGGGNEYTYWTGKIGLNHSFLDKQPANTFSNQFLVSPIGPIQMKPIESYKSYLLGYKGGITLHKDLKNEKMGIIVDLGASNYGVSARYNTPLNPTYWSDVSYSVIAAQGGFFFKIGGKELYDQMRYLYFGPKFSYNVMMYKSETVSWTSEIRHVKLDSKMAKQYNFAGTVGLNYMFFYAELDYIHKGFFTTGYQVLLDNGLPVEPYSIQPSNMIYLSTGINLPLNSWTSRKIYDIETKIRRLFK